MRIRTLAATTPNRMAESNASSGISAKIVPTGIVGHEHDDVGSLLSLRVTPKGRQRR